VVSIPGHGIAGSQEEPDEERVLHAPVIGGHQDRQRFHEMWGDAEPCSSFPHRFARLARKYALHITQSAVKELQTVGGCARCEIGSVDERNRHSAHRRIPGRAGTGNAGADDQNVKLSVEQLVEIAEKRLHGREWFQTLQFSAIRIHGLAPAEKNPWNGWTAISDVSRHCATSSETRC